MTVPEEIEKTSDVPGHSVRDRVSYAPMHRRPRLQLPGAARVAVWTIVNVENWSPFGAMPRTLLPPPMGQPLLPDVPNWAWHEYGMRMGFWRILEALRSRSMKATLAVNGSACAAYPEACEAARDAGWEFMGHGLVQQPMHKVKDQARAIAETIAAIRELTGKPPRGWESPGLAETDDTLDLLAEAGIEYVADWVLDDQPVPLRTRAGPMISVPYTVEINDVVLNAVQQQPSDEILRRGRDQFDRLYLEGADAPRVMAISVHPYLTGVPHRIKYLEALYDHILGHEGVVVWTGEQILDWYREQTGGQTATRDISASR
jgi:peptidoglycan/xylan/chitin deacetylase (PgdA/CDA1 family)